MGTISDKKVLFFLKTPPPLTGSTIINRMIAESIMLNRSFNVKTINISYKKEIRNTSLSLNKISKIFIYLKKLFCSLAFFKPDLVYFQISPLGRAFLRDCIYILVIKLFRKPLLFHLHGKGINNYISNSRIWRTIYKWAFDGSFVICLSEQLSKDITNVYSGTPFIVGNSIPAGSAECSKKIPHKGISVLFLSNLLLSKGIMDYLDALEIFFKSTGLVISGKIIGQRADLDNNTIALEIQKRNLQNRVSYLGPKFGIEKEIELLNSDILVFPTLNDTWGLVILEAMQAGLPVIATNEGAIPEIIENGVTGFIVNKNSPEQIAEKIEYLINNSDLLIKMGEAGQKKFSEKYTPEIFETKMIDVFNKVLSSCS